MTYINRFVKWAEVEMSRAEAVFPMSLKGIFALEIKKQAQQGYVIHPALQEKLDLDMAEVLETLATSNDTRQSIMMNAAFHMTSQYNYVTQETYDFIIRRSLRIVINATNSLRLTEPDSFLAGIMYEVELERAMAKSSSRFDVSCRGGS